MQAETYELLKAMYSYDPGYPLNSHSVGEFQQGRVFVEKLSFDSFHDGKVPGLLALPRDIDGRCPVVLLLHGVSGNKRQWLGDDFTHGGEVLAGLLASGYGVLALDAQYHGERAIYNNFIDPAEMAFKKGWGVRYANMLTQTIVDYRRAIDYLGTRDEVDAARIGVLGYSMGGHMAFILSAVDKRIKTAVACVVPDIPGLPMAAMNFAHDLTNTPFLLMMGRSDPNYSVTQAEALFNEIAAEAKSLRLYDSGHSLPACYTADAVEWLRSRL